LRKILQMKGKGLTISLRNLVSFDEIEDDLKNQAKAMGLRLLSFDYVMKEGEKMNAAEHPFR